jgi:hypothetical protein
MACDDINHSWTCGGNHEPMVVSLPTPISAVKSKHEHDLQVIWTSGGRMVEEVVRWCRGCGAVVVDLDMDNRTHPGYYMKMRLPDAVRRTK